MSVVNLLGIFGVFGCMKEMEILGLKGELFMIFTGIEWVFMIIDCLHEDG